MRHRVGSAGGAPRRGRPCELVETVVWVLITQRSQVQILPPLQMSYKVKVQAKGDFRRNPEAVFGVSRPLVVRICKQPGPDLWLGALSGRSYMNLDEPGPLGPSWALRGRHFGGIWGPDLWVNANIKPETQVLATGRWHSRSSNAAPTPNRRNPREKRQPRCASHAGSDRTAGRWRRSHCSALATARLEAAVVQLK